MNYENYYFGMNFIWWGLGVILLFWIFVMPLNTTNQRRKKDAAYYFLQKRFIIGDITESEYNEQKKILQEEF